MPDVLQCPDCAAERSCFASDDIYRRAFRRLFYGKLVLPCICQSVDHQTFVQLYSFAVCQCVLRFLVYQAECQTRLCA